MFEFCQASSFQLPARSGELKPRADAVSGLANISPGSGIRQGTIHVDAPRDRGDGRMGDR